jgi:hypothetical protein
MTTHDMPRQSHEKTHPNKKQPINPRRKNKIIKHPARGCSTPTPTLCQLPAPFHYPLAHSHAHTYLHTRSYHTYSTCTGPQHMHVINGDDMVDGRKRDGVERGEQPFLATRDSACMHERVHTHSFFFSVTTHFCIVLSFLVGGERRTGEFEWLELPRYRIKKGAFADMSCLRAACGGRHGKGTWRWCCVTCHPPTASVFCVFCPRSMASPPSGSTESYAVRQRPAAGHTLFAGRLVRSAGRRPLFASSIDSVRHNLGRYDRCMTRRAHMCTTA